MSPLTPAGPTSLAAEMNAPPQWMADWLDDNSAFLQEALGKPKYDIRSVELSALLLGSVVCFLTLVYLAHNKDHDLRRHFWRISSVTLTIFLALQIFHLVNDPVLEMFAGVGAKSEPEERETERERQTTSELDTDDQDRLMLKETQAGKEHKVHGDDDLRREMHDHAHKRDASKMEVVVPRTVAPAGAESAWSETSQSQPVITSSSSSMTKTAASSAVAAAAANPTPSAESSLTAANTQERPRDQDSHPGTVEMKLAPPLAATQGKENVVAVVEEKETPASTSPAVSAVTPVPHSVTKEAEEHENVNAVGVEARVGERETEAAVPLASAGGLQTTSGAASRLGPEIALTDPLGTSKGSGSIVTQQIRNANVPTSTFSVAVTEQQEKGRSDPSPRRRSDGAAPLQLVQPSSIVEVTKRRGALSFLEVARRRRTSHSNRARKHGKQPHDHKSSAHLLTATSPPLNLGPGDRLALIAAGEATVRSRQEESISRNREGKVHDPLTDASITIKVVYLQSVLYLLWFGVLQLFCLMVECGCFEWSRPKSWSAAMAAAAAGTSDMNSTAVARLERAERKTFVMAWSSLLGYISMFSLLHVFSSLQTLTNNLGMAFALVFVCPVVAATLWETGRFVRFSLLMGNYGLAAARQEDQTAAEDLNFDLANSEQAGGGNRSGEQDAAGAQQREVAAYDSVEAFAEWETQTSDIQSENVGVATSFLTVQAIQFAVVGALPDFHGQQKPEEGKVFFTPTDKTFPTMAAIVIGTALVADVLVRFVHRRLKEVPRFSFQSRLFQTITVVLCMIFAWELLLVLRWAVAATCPSISNMIIFKLAVAMFVTVFGAVMIGILDAVEDFLKPVRQVLFVEEGAGDVGGRGGGRRLFSGGGRGGASARGGRGLRSDRESSLDDLDTGTGHFAPPLSPQLTQENLEKMIFCVGIIVGFAWNHAFEVAMLAVNQEIDGAFRTDFGEKHNLHLMMMFLRLLLILTALPAWRYYIFPQLVKHKDEYASGRVLEEVDQESVAAQLIGDEAAEKFEAWKKSKLEGPMWRFFWTMYALGIVGSLGIIATYYVNATKTNVF